MTETPYCMCGHVPYLHKDTYEAEDPGYTEDAEYGSGTCSGVDSDGHPCVCTTYRRPGNGPR